MMPVLGGMASTTNSRERGKVGTNTFGPLGPLTVQSKASSATDHDEEVAGEYSVRKNGTCKQGAGPTNILADLVGQKGRRRQETRALQALPGRDGTMPLSVPLYLPTPKRHPTMTMLCMCPPKPPSAGVQ